MDLRMAGEDRTLRGSYYYIDEEWVYATLLQLGFQLPKTKEFTERARLSHESSGSESGADKATAQLPVAAASLGGSVERTVSSQKKRGAERELTSKSVIDYGLAFATGTLEGALEGSQDVSVNRRIQRLTDHWLNTVEDLVRRAKRYGFDEIDGLRGQAELHAEKIAQRELDELLVKRARSDGPDVFGVTLYAAKITTDEQVVTVSGEACVYAGRGEEESLVSAGRVVAYGDHAGLTRQGRSLVGTDGELAKATVFGQFRGRKNDAIALSLFTCR